ncbi:DedA family protein [Pedobacter fastidiosus]|uniref:DedA family protein n=1 Tax=Pedobacter fastidiosus TaxID=2765361 RepID=UPI00361E2F0C
MAQAFSRKKNTQIEIPSRCAGILQQAWGKVHCFLPFQDHIPYHSPVCCRYCKDAILRFFTYNAIGGVCWILIMLYTGYFLGQIPWFKTHFDVVVLLIIGVSLLPAIWAAVKSRLQLNEIQEGLKEIDP